MHACLTSLCPATAYPAYLASRSRTVVIGVRAACDKKKFVGNTYGPAALRPASRGKQGSRHTLRATSTNPQRRASIERKSYWREARYGSANISLRNVIGVPRNIDGNEGRRAPLYDLNANMRESATRRDIQPRTTGRSKLSFRLYSSVTNLRLFSCFSCTLPEINVVSCTASHELLRNVWF